MNIFLVDIQLGQVSIVSDQIDIGTTSHEFVGCPLLQLLIRRALLFLWENLWLKLIVLEAEVFFNFGEDCWAVGRGEMEEKKYEIRLWLQRRQPHRI